MKQLVYRQERSDLFEEMPEDFRGHFVCCARVRVLILNVMIVVSCMGLAGYLKCLLKLLSGRRKLVFVLHNNQMASYAWIMFGSCRHYDVEKNSAVIGPVFTDPELRGRGFASFLLKRAMDVMVSDSIGIFYIDTSEKNESMQRVIEKCGFGLPVQSFERES